MSNDRSINRLSPLTAAQADTAADSIPVYDASASGIKTKKMTLDALGATYLPGEGRTTDNLTALLANNLGKVYNVLDFGALGDGTTDDTEAIQEAVDRIDTAGSGTLLLPAGKTFLVEEEVELRADNMVVILHGATIKGPAAGTVDGTLMAICDRTALSRVIENVWVLGGLFQPQNASDNGIAVVSAHHVLLDGARANLATGLRGIVVQTDSTFTGGSGLPLRHITVANCSAYGGGTDGLNIESAGGNLIADVVVSGFRCVDAGTGIRMSTGDDSYRMDRIAIDNVVLSGCDTGITWARVRKSVLSNVVIDGATVSGIDARLADQCSFANIRVSGSGVGGAIALTLGTGFSLVNAVCDGAFAYGIYNEMTDASFSRVTVKSATTGLHTTAATQRSVYDDFTFESCTTNVNTFRAGDRYEGFKVRSGTEVQPMGGTVSADRGDTAQTLTVHVDAPTQRWSTELTADRAVTLSTTGAYAGAQFRIVRSATGAFNLNVGTGPLKALAAGEWCVVEYDGTAWFLQSYGAL